MCVHSFCYSITTCHRKILFVFSDCAPISLLPPGHHYLCLEENSE
uniref:Uncharacterized protein n=1 Tax=Arundo donax TaxID=35708 RepID=A0A0A9C703_ARUDO